jgi:CRISPR-associated protein (TIGR02710 family)
VICEKKEGLLNLITGYKKWDLMEWEEASNLFKGIDLTSSISEKTVENQKFLNTLANLYNKMDPKNKDKLPDTSAPRNKTIPYIMILADMLNNAQRRIGEGKYDDAVARLYRSVELISQIMLLDKGIDEINGRICFSDLIIQIKNSSDLEKYRSRIEKQDTQELRKDMGARAKFQLLMDIGDARGWNHYSKIRTDMENRNNSIMAHGLKPVGKNAADRFYASVLDFSYDIFNKKTMEKFMQQSQFPKL